MREATIILPRHAVAERELERDLLRYFGGFSRQPITGSWINDKTGERYDDDSTLYTVAMEVTGGNASRLYTLARDAGLASGQITVYVRQADGKVEFADTGLSRGEPNPRETVAMDERILAYRQDHILPPL